MPQIKVELQAVYGGDREIAEAAWTSSTTLQAKDARSEEDTKRVVNMLADLKHSVPFESVIFRFWFRLPIATDRQLMTHRIASHSGMSGRYRTMPEEFLAMPQDVIDALAKIEPELGNVIENQYATLCHEANNWYKNLTKALKTHEKAGTISNADYKRVREFVRGVLPQHNMTERVTVMNLRSFANFIKLRSKPDAQPEIRHLAELMLTQVRESGKCPIAIESLERNGWSI